MKKQTTFRQRNVWGSLALVLAGLVFLLMPRSVLALAAPTILSPANGYTLPPDTPFVVRGLVPNNALVYFFVDGKLIGGVKAKNGSRGTASFAYTAKKSFTKGKHTLVARAVLGSESSAYTTSQTFTIPTVWGRRLDGVIVPAEKANVLPIAVMIENIASVRPQPGLSSASVVYETLAEGGIPRLLAIFPNDTMTKVGPVRSARPYFVEWAKEYNAPFFHAGGSPDALTQIRKLKVRDADALRSATAKYFYRADRSASTHNLFTSATGMQRFKKDAQLTKTKASFQAWRFKNAPKLAERPKKERQLNIDFHSGAAYAVSFRYDRATNTFVRWNGGRIHRDAGGKKLRAHNVIVQLVPKEKILDRKSRIELRNVGTGKGWLAQDGVLIPITWKKATESSRTRFYLPSKKEVEFNRGTTWVEVVPKNRTVLWK